jgi:hypothetical protein
MNIVQNVRIAVEGIEVGDPNARRRSQWFGCG